MPEIITERGSREICQALGINCRQACKELQKLAEALHKVEEARNITRAGLLHELEEITANIEELKKEKKRTPEELEAMKQDARQRWETLERLEKEEKEQRAKIQEIARKFRQWKE